jgi:hypothetical protein
VFARSAPTSSGGGASGLSSAMRAMQRSNNKSPFLADSHTTVADASEATTASQQQTLSVTREEAQLLARMKSVAERRLSVS